MKEKIFIGIIGGISIIATSIPIYNYYILPVIRNKEMLDKIDGFDKRLKIRKIIIYKMKILEQRVF
jgi:hypothetical protein